MTGLAKLDKHTRKRRKRVGRGPGSGMGKTSCRGQKGQGARSGYKRRWGNEGGQCPLFTRLPTRGFSNARFQKRMDCINLVLIDRLYEEGEIVNLKTLRERGFLKGKSHGLKVLGNGELKKKVKIEADAFSESAKKKLDAAGLEYSLLKRDA